MAVVFVASAIGPSSAQMILPLPGERVALSPVFVPPLLKGIKVYRNDPFRFDFILDKGDGHAGAIHGSPGEQQDLKIETNRLIRYFLASLTIPEKDLWVNLSPYEKDRIVPEAFGQTEMGRDLLAQDYILKQITASVIYPEGEIGKEFWAKVYAEAQKRYGTTDVPIDTFNKVWIVPEKATVYENKDAAFVVESKLKVMLEEDYRATSKNADVITGTLSHAERVKEGDLTKQILREIVIPILEKEVNEGRNFAPLRQVYYSLILATWYKRKVKESILGQAYVDHQKTAGIDIADKNEKEKIWQKYVEAFKKGASNFIKEEYDPTTQQIIPRKYFSGGTSFDPTLMNAALKWTHDPSMLTNVLNVTLVKAYFKPLLTRIDALYRELRKPQPKPGTLFFKTKEHDGLYFWLRDAFIGKRKDALKEAVLLHVDFHPDDDEFGLIYNWNTEKGENDPGNDHVWPGSVITAIYHDKKMVHEVWWLYSKGSKKAGYAVDAKPDTFAYSQMLGHSLPKTDRPVILGIDLDAFVSKEEKNVSIAEALKRVDEFIKTLGKRQYKVLGIFIASSPQYTPASHLQLIENYLNERLTELYDLSDGLDAAMKENTGGIDLNPDKLNLNTQINGDVMAFSLDPAMLQRMQSASGVTPVIMDIRPLDSLPAFLGTNSP